MSAVAPYSSESLRDLSAVITYSSVETTGPECCGPILLRESTGLESYYWSLRENVVTPYSSVESTRLECCGPILLMESTGFQCCDPILLMESTRRVLCSYTTYVVYGNCELLFYIRRESTRLDSCSPVLLSGVNGNKGAGGEDSDIYLSYFLS